MEKSPDQSVRQGYQLWIALIPLVVGGFILLFYLQDNFSETDALAFWRQRALIVGGLGAAMLAAMLYVLFVLFRSQRREQAANERLRRHRDQLKAAQRIAGLGSWEIELATMFVDGSDELFRIFEVATPTNGRARYQDFLAQVHPEDRAAVDAALNESIDERRPVSIRHRLQLPDGRIKHVLECCEVEFGPDGTP